MRADAHGEQKNGVVRYRRRVSFGQSLYLLVMPTGRRYWQYRYRFEGRQNVLSFGRYPYVPIETAWARRHAARHFIEAGVDPAGEREALRRIFVSGVDQIDRRAGATSPSRDPAG